MREMRYSEALSLLVSIGSRSRQDNDLGVPSMLGSGALLLQNPNNLPKHDSNKPTSADQLKRLEFVEDGWELASHGMESGSAGWICTST